MAVNVKLGQFQCLCSETSKCLLKNKKGEEISIEILAQNLAISNNLFVKSGHQLAESLHMKLKQEILKLLKEDFCSASRVSAKFSIEWPLQFDIQSTASINKFIEESKPVKLQETMYTVECVLSAVTRIWNIHFANLNHNKSINCPECNFQCDYNSLLKKHIKSVHKGPNVCDICKKKFAYKKRLEQHMTMCQTLKCRHCNYTGRDQFNIKRHMELTHGVEKEPADIPKEHHSHNNEDEMDVDQEPSGITI